MKTPCLILVAILAVAFTGVLEAAEKEKWEVQRSRHFFVYYKDAPEEFVQEVEEAAEQYFDDITADLGFRRLGGWSFDARGKIYIYDDREDFLAAYRRRPWAFGIVNPREKIIRTFPTANGFFDSTLPHEIGHIIFREFVGFDKRLPLWVDEGVAVNQERSRAWGAHDKVRKALEDGTFIPLKELGLVDLSGNESQELVDLFYAEAASIMNFLMVGNGNFRFHRFCQKLRDGVRFEDAIRSSYYRYRNLKELNRAWVAYLESKGK